MNLELTCGYLIHSRPFKETSLIVDFFSKEQGRFSAIARGAKRPRSQYKGVLQPFQPLVVAAFGRNDLLTATRIESNGRAWTLTGMSLISGLYLNELLVRLLPRHETNTVIFEQYEAALQALSTGHELSLALRRFEKNLLVELGYGIDFHQDSQGRKIEPHRKYGFDPNHGLVVLESAQSQTIQGQTLLDFEQGQVSEQGLKELKWMFRRALHGLLGGQPLKTRELARQLGAVT